MEELSYFERRKRLAIYLRWARTEYEAQLRADLTTTDFETWLAERLLALFDLPHNGIIEK